MNHVKSMKTSPVVLMVIALAVTVGGLCSEAGALPHVFPDPSLPPVHPTDPLISYYGRNMHVIFPGDAVLYAPRHHGFTNVIRETVGADEIETFDSIMDVTVGFGLMPPVEIRLTGPVSTIVYGKAGNTTGDFQTEIISMSLIGDLGGASVEIRENPNMPSAGRTTITDLGGGLYEIDSFFDVFTELSRGGAPFEPAPNSGRMELCPEPATMAMVIVGGLAVLRRRRRV
jgi:hypothetical protein